MPMTGRTARLAASFLVAAGVCRAAAAVEQTAPGFALSRFEPAEHGSSFFGVESLDWRNDGRPVFGWVGDYAYKPLVIYAREANAAAGKELLVVARHQLVGHLGGSLNFGERLRVGLDLPLAFYGAGDAGQIGLEKFLPPQSAGLGDLRVAGDWRLFGQPGESLVGAVGARLFLPIGSSQADVSDGRLRVDLHAQGAGQVGSIIWGARFGYLYRSLHTTLSEGTIGSELQLGLAAGWKGMGGKLVVGPELTAATRAASDAFHGLVTPVDLLLGAHYDVAPNWRLGAGLGRGLTSAFGDPTVRGVFSATWVPSAADAPVVEKSVAAPDRDGDGVPDALDACPEAQGPAACDGRFTGCPLVDTDQDGVLDRDDACVDVKGEKSAEPRTNGCPLGDTDQDGIPDRDDACVDVKGVASAIRALNGCAADSDHDGVADAADACPNEPGQKSIDKAKNGCPAGAVAGDQIVMLDQVVFETSSDKILKVSDETLQKVLDAIRQLPGAYRFRVEGHTDDRGDNAMNQALSATRAKSVVEWMAAHGVPATRFEPSGFGKDKPVASNDTEEGRQANRRVEFHIIKPEAR